MNAKSCHRLAALCLVIGVSSGASGQSAQDFYKNKQIRLISGHPVGGDYDVGARFLAKHLQKHIPGQPAVIVQNMPQAASIVAANFVHNLAPRDGTVIGSFSRNFASQAMMGQPNIEADPRRFIWLGAYSLPSRVCVDWHTAPVKTPDDLFTHELIIAGGGAGSSLSIIPSVLNHVLGTKFRVIEGYKGINDASLAIERGEVQGPSACPTHTPTTTEQLILARASCASLFHAEENAGCRKFRTCRHDLTRLCQDSQRTAAAAAVRVFERRVCDRPYAAPAGRSLLRDRVAAMRLCRKVVP